MDPTNAAIEGGRRMFHQLLSMGYDEDHARATAVAHVGLCEGASKLARCGHPTPEDDKLAIWVSAFGDNNLENVLFHDDVLLPKWNNFAEALSSVPTSKHGYISLLFQQVQLDKAVSGMLLQSFKTAPLKSLTLKNNGPGSDGIQFVVNAVKSNATLELLGIDSNHIESEHDATTLVSAVIKHPRLDGLLLDKCGLGENNAAMAVLFPTIVSLAEVSLDGNNIGSYGAKLISVCLATNPDIEVLHLTNNLLNDEDATLLAESMKTNTNLRRLRIAGNRLAQDGVKALTTAVADCSSLNTLYDSNHTCQVEDGEEIYVNYFADPTLNRKLKILGGLQHSSASYINLLHFNDVPFGIMPRVLVFLQGKGLIYASIINEYGLSAVFEFMREWSMPILYQPHWCRAERECTHFRKKKITHLMGK